MPGIWVPYTPMARIGPRLLDRKVMRSYGQFASGLARKKPIATTWKLIPPFQPLVLQQSFHSALSLQSISYNFEDIKLLSETRSRDKILIDVREPAEYQAGFIPTALNIPITSQPDALLLTAEEFEDRFGFAKPDNKSEIIFYCKAGVRSKAAAKLAQQGGYEKIGEYAGSWLDWAAKGGSSSKP